MSMIKVLVVDDEMSFTKMLRLSLEQTGKFEVKEENIAVNAMNSIRLFKPDIVLLDIIMPEMGGELIAQQILDDEELKLTKIIFLTALVTKGEMLNISKDTENASAGGRISKHIFIAKPVKIDELIACIEQNLQ